MVKLSEQELVRREKLDGLRKLGINPYPASQFPVNFYAKDLTDSYTDGKEVILAGRLMSRRIQGKASFAELLDSSGRIQIYLNRDEICLGEDGSTDGTKEICHEYLEKNSDKITMITMFLL